MSAAGRLVALDRDGTINVERHYLADPAALELLPGAAAAIRILRGLGLPVVVVTNQSGIGRGYFPAETSAAIHVRLAQLLAEAGASLDGIYVCPHRPEEGCACRKPASGLLEQAARDHGAELGRSFVIGDKSCDIEAGKRVGATTLLVRTGHGETTLQNHEAGADHVVDDLEKAARVIARLVTEEDRVDLDGIEHRGRARAHFLESAATDRAIAEDCLDQIVEAGAEMARCLREGGKIMFCGNGGSAADSQHLAAEFTNRLTADFDRPALAALALTVDPCFITAHANDFAFSTIYSRQVEALGKSGDVLVAITTSGNSENVLRAVLAARALGIRSIGLLGGTGGRLRRHVDVAIVVPNGDTHHIQEGHIAIGHVLVDMAEQILFKSQPVRAVVHAAVK
jgi:histidinol-phosphate phosphatase family protein